MSFKEFPIEDAHKILAPRPTVIVTTKNSNDEVNAAPYSFVMPVSIDPSVIAISSSLNRDTLKNIEENQEFVLNLVTEDIIQEMWITGEDLAYGENELDKAKLTEKISKDVEIPAIEEAIANLECIAINILDIGNHKLIIGEVLNIYVKEDMIKDGVLDVIKAKPLLHLDGDNFVVGNNLRKVNDN